MNQTEQWFYWIIGLAGIYALLRLLWFIPQRLKYNRTHRIKVWVVSMGDIPYFFASSSFFHIWLPGRFGNASVRQ